MTVYFEDVDHPDLHLLLLWESVVFRSGVMTAWFSVSKQTVMGCHVYDPLFLNSFYLPNCEGMYLTHLSPILRHSNRQGCGVYS